MNSMHEMKNHEFIVWFHHEINSYHEYIAYQLEESESESTGRCGPELAVKNTSVLLPERSGWRGPTEAYKQASIDYNADKTLLRLDKV
jgi:hypothetical protein